MEFDFNEPELAQLRALAETTPDAFVTIDADSRIQFANPAIETILGYTPGELIGRPLTDLMSEDLRRRHVEALDRYLETGRRHLDWNRVELPGQHRDGHEVPLEITFSEFSVDGERFFAGVLRDVSDRKTLEAERNLLHAAKEQVIQAETFSEGLTNALALLGESMNWVVGGAWVPADDADRLECAATWTASETDPGAFREASAEWAFEPGEGLVGRVWETGEYEWIPDVSTSAAPAFERRAATDGLGAALGVPILADDSVVAVLVFLMSEERPVDDRMIEATRTVAANLGLLMARKRAEEALRRERNLVSNILETSPTGIAVVDADGEFRYANDRAAKLLRLGAATNGTAPTFENLPARILDADGEPIPESERLSRYVLRTGADVERDVQVEYPDGTRRRLSVAGTALRNDAGDVSAAVLTLQDVTEREGRADRLQRLNGLGQALSEAETFEEAGDVAVVAARDVLGLPVAAIERYDAETGRLQPCACTARVDELVGGGSLFASERGLPWQVFAESESRAYADLDREEALDADETPLSSAILVPLGKHGVFVSGATAPDAFTETTVALAEILAQNVIAAFDRLDREVSLRERAAELEAKNEELQRIQRANWQIRDVMEALLDAESSAEIQQLVCDRLAAREPYRFVWFGERDPVTDEVVPTARAGIEEGYLDAVTITAGPNAAGQGPTGRAIQTGDVQVQNNLQSDPPFEPWRQEALQRGYRASIAIPVAYQDTLYGALNLYADEPEVFSEVERSVLADLGELIGYALTAMERYDALVAQESIELEFAIRDASDPLLGLLREHDGQFRFEGVAGRDGQVRLFGAFEDIPFEEIETLVDSCAGFEDVTLIRERGEEVVVELALTGDAFVASLLDRGAVPTAIRATPDESQMTIRVSKSASVREFVERFRRRYEDVDLITRRTVSDPIQTREGFERAYLDNLTDRQRQVLRTAYFAGFFEQPRGSTAREVAEVLDISQPTVSRHVRAAEQTLFGMLFDDDSE